MDVSKINPFLNQMGFNASNISNPSNQTEIQMFATENGISIVEAEKIIKEAQEKISEKDNLFKEYSEIQELLKAQDQEEIIEIDDMDFDNFLNEDNPEQKIQELLSKQQFLNNNQNLNQNQNKSNDKSGENIFLKRNW